MLGLKATMSIIDNSGALVAECVNVLKQKTGHGMAGIGSLQLPPREKRNHARASRVLTLGTRRNAGDEIVVVIKRARPQPQSTQQSSSAAGGGAPKVRKGDVRHAVVVRTKYPTRRPDGRYVRFDDNAAVLVNNKKEMIGNRIGGVVAAELRARGWGKIVSLAPKVV
ncbi:hypothetical protein BMF94_4128 [Rhodotorula taiwanensis]|uniref:Uncharacterized protein n=1 Tax=Rhodotorula taiwanensis TaxID=741276 RepID=A0A2S5B7L9_9BASI|nr:hypothetical protein BMF94_4128 [Rhodotorula taiwanensis]